jgi:Acetoacetate decarboxylase (ADC)
MSLIGQFTDMAGVWPFGRIGVKPQRGNTATGRSARVSAMLPDDPQLKPQYRMPRVFGALPGPRNVPRDRQHLPNRQRNLVLSVTALSDAAALGALLPPHCELDGEPLLTVSLNYMSNIGWLAGRDYAILSVIVNMRHQSPTRGLLRGTYLPVLWENLCDPIISGRDELGFAKLYAELPPPVIVGDRYSGCALWQGFRFCDLEVDEVTAAAPTPPPPIGAFQYKFIPRTASLGAADVEYLEYCEAGKSAAGYAPLSLTHKWTGRGRVAFQRARWEDVPFQYPIQNALAALPLHEIRGASVTRFEAQGTIGDPCAGALQPL